MFTIFAPVCLPFLWCQQNAPRARFNFTELLESAKSGSWESVMPRSVITAWAGARHGSTMIHDGWVWLGPVIANSGLHFVWSLDIYKIQVTGLAGHSVALQWPGKDNCIDQTGLNYGGPHNRSQQVIFEARYLIVLTISLTPWLIRNFEIYQKVWGFWIFFPFWRSYIEMLELRPFSQLNVKIYISTI